MGAQKSVVQDVGTISAQTAGWDRMRMSALLTFAICPACAIGELFPYAHGCSLLHQQCEEDDLWYEEPWEMPEEYADLQAKPNQLYKFLARKTVDMKHKEEEECICCGVRWITICDCSGNGIYYVTIRCERCDELFCPDCRYTGKLCACGMGKQMPYSEYTPPAGYTPSRRAGEKL